MVEDLNFLKVKKFFFFIFFTLFFSSNSFSQNYNFQELAKLDEPWGSSFLNDNELINRVYYELKNPTAEISLLNNEEPIRISEVGGAQNGSRLTFVTWTKEGAPFYCLEPWMSPPNAPENKTCRMVPAGARDEFTVEIELA